MANKTPVFEITRGDDIAYKVIVRDTQDPPVAMDITGWVFKATMKLNHIVDHDLDADLAVDYPPLQGADAQAGIFYLTFSSEQTSKLLPAVYFFDLQRESSGAVVTVLNERVRVIADVTTRTG